MCKFLEVSKLSFLPEYGPKLKEEYIMVKHLPKIMHDDDEKKCCSCQWCSCCRDNWQKVTLIFLRNFHDADDVSFMHMYRVSLRLYLYSDRTIAFLLTSAWKWPPWILIVCACILFAQQSFI